MITKCVTCGAPLAHDAPPPRCARCGKPYCSLTCLIESKVVTTLTEIERTARRVLGDGHPTTVNIARFLQIALRDLHNAVETLAETERTTRRVLGSAHPVTAGIEAELRDARATLAASETPSPRDA